MNTIENAIAKNRAEELGYDLWEDFVIPPFYDSLDLLTARKPRVIVGGRGCGKTFLLRYLCHQTQFSHKRKHISVEDIKNIGITWRIDTYFAKMLSKRGVPDDVWHTSFVHLSVLMMCQEILKSLESIANSSLKEFEANDLVKFNFSVLNSFNDKVPSTFIELKAYIRKQTNYFQTWAGNVRSEKPPVFLPLGFVIELINEIKNQNILFRDTIYLVYIDEYENLLTPQQRQINTWMKHSEMPLIFNLAMKPNSFADKRTIGKELIVETHDYREYDLEDFYNKINFAVYAAEILFLRLWKKDESFKIPIYPEELKSVENDILEKRRSQKYKKKVLDSAKDFLPSTSVEKMAEAVFSDEILLKRLKELLERALKNNAIKRNIDDFLISDFPQVGVIMPALLNRDISLAELLKEIDNLRNGRDNKFTGATNWIHNNIFGCLLFIYEPLGRFCPLYSGFEAFCLMSKTNLRYFLELCYKSIANERLNDNQKVLKNVSIKSQAEAAKQASVIFLREVKNFGNDGSKLHTFVLRLGTYFSYSHKKLSQSEPEQNHFTIMGNRPKELNRFIDDAVKWSVIYENRITKQKGGAGKFEAEDFEYILNPIYAPYFHISYRKKRSVAFRVDEISTMIFGNYSDFESFLKRKLQNWQIPSTEATIGLFKDLED